MFIDAGPMIAAVNRNDADHQRAVEFITLRATEPFTTVWPAFTEAMHFLGKAGGIYAQSRLWALISAGRIHIRNQPQVEQERMEALMRKYADLPMDLADAGIVAAAEATGNRRVFSFDTEFRIYRLDDDSVLEVFP